MSTTQTEAIELTTHSTEKSLNSIESANDVHIEDGGGAPPSAVEAIPDGGYGWTVVFACSVITFMINGWTGCWGVLQTAILQTQLEYFAVFRWLAQYRHLCVPRACLRPIITSDRCTLQYVAGCSHDGLWYSIQ